MWLDLPDRGSTLPFGGSIARRAWNYWKMPALAGVGFGMFQVWLLAALFEFGGPFSRVDRAWTWLASMAPGLGLFCLGGMLAVLLVRRLLRGAAGSWLLGLICLAGAATPIAFIGSLAVGMYGSPLLVPVAAPLPYLLLVGLPVLGRELWILPARETGSQEAQHSTIQQ